MINNKKGIIIPSMIIGLIIIILLILFIPKKPTTYQLHYFTQEDCLKDRNQLLNQNYICDECPQFSGSRGDLKTYCNLPRTTFSNFNPFIQSNVVIYTP